MQISSILNRSKIVALLGNSGSGRSELIKEFEMNKKNGIIDYNAIKCNTVNEQLEYYDKLYKFKIRELDDRKNEIMRMLEIDERILPNSIYEISESELVKVLIASVLLYNPEVIIIDDLLSSLDYRNKKKIMKLFIKLKSFFDKKIVIVSSDIDDIYEFLDEVIVLDEGKIIFNDNKYRILEYYDELLDKDIHIPNIIKFIKKMRDKGVKIDNVDTINELIKTIYREVM